MSFHYDKFIHHISRSVFKLVFFPLWFVTILKLCYIRWSLHHPSWLEMWLRASWWDLQNKTLVPSPPKGLLPYEQEQMKVLICRGAKNMSLLLFINDLPSAVRVRWCRFWQMSRVRRASVPYPCKVQLGTLIVLVFVSHFLLKRCHFVKFSTITVENFWGGLVLVRRKNSVVHWCCLSVCLLQRVICVTNMRWIPH